MHSSPLLETSLETDFDELESIINPKPTRDSDSGDFDDLEALLGEALADKKQIEQVKAARAKAKGGFGLSAADLERIKSWELVKEWLPVANVALFHRYTCNCGFHVTLFEGLMLEQRHRSDSRANRWTSQDEEQSGLPMKTAIRKSDVLMCQRCAAGNGYPLATDLEWSI